MLRAKHLNEWLESAVDEDLVRLNVQSIDGSMGELSPKHLLLRDDPDATLQNKGFSNAREYRAYNRTDEGGWLVLGEDDYLQIKPDNPRPDDQKPGKFIKYESPRKVEPTLFKLKVSDRIWDKIKTNLWTFTDDDCDWEDFHHSLIDSDEFWDWVKANPQLPIVITEGAKKAGALLTAGYIAIALPGITMGVRSKRNGVSVPRHLIGRLEELAVEGRELIICFDQDSKPKTIANVNRAIASLGIALKTKGCQVSVTHWDSPEKGVDDFIVAHGESAFSDVFCSRRSFSEYLQARGLDIKPYVSLQVQERYLSEGIHPDPNAQIIGIKSAKNTGKTEWLARIATKATAEGRRVLLLTHRIQLGQALCNRFGIDYVSEFQTSETKGILGIGLCVDSLHPDSQANFNPEDWEDALIVIDECEQVFWHLLNSNTCQSQRVQILENFKAVLQIAVSTGGKVYLSDADLSPIAIEYVKEMLGGEVGTWVVENTFKPVIARKAFLYGGNSPTGLFALLNDAIANGEKVLLHTSSQGVDKRWSTQTLEEYFRRKYPHLNILRIDRETVANPSHRAYGCIPQLNDLLLKFDIVIASPSVETGVSIDVKHFASVWCIAWGVQTVDAVSQTIERVRDDVPRHIWANQRGLCWVGNQSTNPYQLRQSTKKITRANIALLRQADDDELEVDTNFQASLHTWSKRGAMVNTGMWSYRESLIAKLTSEGYQIGKGEEIDQELSKAISDLLGNVRDGNYTAFRKKVVESEDVSDSKYQELKSKRSKTDSEIATEHKAKLSRRYGIEVTEELVEKDDQGWYGELQLLYYLTDGEEFLNGRDRASLDSLSGDTGKAFSPDVTKRLLGAKLHALKVLDVKQFFDEEATFTSETLADWLQSGVLPYQKELRDVGYRVTSSSYPVKVANGLLKRVGQPYKLKCIGREGKDGERIYQPVKIDDGREFIFEKWLELDRLLRSKVEAKNATVATTALLLENDTATTSLKPQNPNPAKVTDTATTKNVSPELLDLDLDKELQEKESSPEIIDVAGWLESCGDAETLGEILKVFASDTATFTQDVINHAWGLLKEGKRRLLRNWWEVATG